MSFWVHLATDCLCIFTAAVLVGIATESAGIALVATAATGGILYWWRGYHA